MNFSSIGIVINGEESDLSDEEGSSKSEGAVNGVGEETFPFLVPATREPQVSVAFQAEVRDPAWPPRPGIERRREMARALPHARKLIFSLHQDNSSGLPRRPPKLRLLLHLRCPNGGKNGHIYVWRGSKCDPYYYTLVDEVTRELINRDNAFTVHVLDEGVELEQFWEALGGKKEYDREPDFMNYTRLFRCTNDKGYFSVSEKIVDFCQDDLEDEDVMVVDSGEHVFLWLGQKFSEVEVKLDYKAAQVYIRHMQMKDPTRNCRLFLSIKGRESKRFTRLFHGWAKHEAPAGDTLTG